MCIMSLNHSKSTIQLKQTCKINPATQRLLMQCNNRLFFSTPISSRLRTPPTPTIHRNSRRTSDASVNKTDLARASKTDDSSKRTTVYQREAQANRCTFTKTTWLQGCQGEIRALFPENGTRNSSYDCRIYRPVPPVHQKRSRSGNKHCRGSRRSAAPSNIEDPGGRS